MNKSELSDPEVFFEGADPYDALSAPLFSVKFLSKSKLINTSFIQLFKHSPVNLRPLFRVRPAYNAKGLSLLLLAFYMRRESKVETFSLKRAEFIESQLLKLKDPEYGGWGYPFPWQSRSFFFKKGLSNTVVSSFAGSALIEGYRIHGRNRGEIESVKNFFLNHLNRSGSKESFCFSYSAIDKSRIFNTSLLAGSFLIKYCRFIDDQEEIRAVLKPVFRYVLEAQLEEGGWFYGKADNLRWIDSFHTGYVLCSLLDYYEFTEDKAVLDVILKGYNFYIERFFTSQGQPAYYHNSLWPADIHSAAQALITVNRLKSYTNSDSDNTLSALRKWVYENLWSEKGKYYFFQKKRFYTIKINYQRWAQAWMYYALSYDKER